MTTPVPEVTETVVSGVKIASAIDHLRNNRIEYLVLLVLSHMLGFTSTLVTKVQGVCY